MRKIFIYIEGDLQDGTQIVTINKGGGRFPKNLQADEVAVVMKEELLRILNAPEKSNEAQTPAKPGK